MVCLNTVFGVVIGILIYSFACTDKCPSKWNQVKFGSHIIHAHHWLIHIIGLIVLMFIPRLRDIRVFRGIIAGGIVHGLGYPDWYILWK